MYDLGFVSGVSDASANLRKEGGDVLQGMRLSSIADDERHPVFVVQVAPLETGRSIEVDLFDGIGRLAYGITFTQFLFILGFGIPRCRTYDLDRFGSEFESANHFGDKLHAVDEDVQVVGQIVLQHFRTLQRNVFIGLGGLSGTDVDFGQMRSSDLTDGKMFQFLQDVLPFDGCGRHISDAGESSRQGKEILDGGMPTRVGIEKYVSFVHQQEEFLVRVYPDAL